MTRCMKHRICNTCSACGTCDNTAEHSGAVISRVAVYRPCRSQPKPTTISNNEANTDGAGTVPRYWENMMKTFGLNLKPLCLALLAAGFLSACGGGGGSDSAAPSPGTTTPGGTTPGGTTPGGTTPGGTTPDTGTPSTAVPPVSSTASMVMSCPGGATVQCSGDSIIRTDNDITLTSSGVQAYGQSTSDLANPIVVRTGASGFAPASGGHAEIRISKVDASATPSAPIVILRNLGLSWDNRVDRPPIVETSTPPRDAPSWRRTARFPPPRCPPRPISTTTTSQRSARPRPRPTMRTTATSRAPIRRVAAPASPPARPWKPPARA